jgi:hypothetical protein
MSSDGGTELPLQPAAARLRVMSLFGEILSVSLANLPVLLTVSFLAGLPLMLSSSPWGRASYARYLGLMLIGYTVRSLRSGFALHLVAAAREGRRVPLAKSFQVGVEEALGAVKVAVVLGAMLWLAFVVLVVPVSLLAHTHPEVVLGAALLDAAAGIWLASVFGVSVPLAIRENASVLESLRRSARLSRGHRWPLALLFTLFAGLSLGANRLLALVLSAPGSQELARNIVLAIVGALGAPALSVVYFRLRRDHDSRSAAALAANFD